MPSENWWSKFLHILFAAIKAFLKVGVPRPESIMVWHRNLYWFADNLCFAKDTLNQKLLLTWAFLTEVAGPLIQELPVP